MEQILEKYSVSEAKENLSGLLAEVEASGRSFVISRYGKPVAIVSAYESENKITPKLRGSLNAYANADLIEQEKLAWKKAVCK
jgi:prevent-host-death family protein